MSIVVEDGAGRADAESYASVAQASTYLAARGMSLWADEMTDEQREWSLRRATDYMTQAYRTRWAGCRVSSTQALDWPRYDVPLPDRPGAGAYPSLYPSDAVPTEVRNACIEMAFKAAFGELTTDIGQVKKSVTVGPITTVYADGSAPVKRFLAIDRLLAPLLVGGGTPGLKVVRA